MSPRLPNPRLVCVTPVRNESWILERFLRAAELWADEVVVADQGSTDATRQIAARFEKVTLVENRSVAYDEAGRQRLLLGTARRNPGPKVIVALDADEALSHTWRQSAEWQRAVRSPPGTVLAFDWVNLLPGEKAYIPHERVPFGFIDDGSDHFGDRIHSTRIPVAPGSPVVPLSDVKLLHFQYVDWRRMKSKQRWYQCWEALNHPEKRPIQIYRQYHRMDAFPEHEVHATDPEWLAGYAAAGIDLSSSSETEHFWWDEEVLDWILTHGARRFAKLNIWDVDWLTIAERSGRHIDPAQVQDPRSHGERTVHRWLRATQGGIDRSTTRWMQRALIPMGW